MSNVILCGEYMPRDNVVCIHPDWNCRNDCYKCERMGKSDKKDALNAEQLQELRETIEEIRDSDGNLSQKELSEYLLNYIDVLLKKRRSKIMRKVEVYEDSRKEKLIAIGQFHQFGVDCFETNEGVGNWSTVIVELEDGSVITPMTNEIKFVKEDN